MIDIEKLTKGQRLFLNSIVIGGISFFSSLMTTGGIPTIENVFAGLLGGGLVCLIRINDLLSREPPSNKKPPLNELLLIL